MFEYKCYSVVVGGFKMNAKTVFALLVVDICIPLTFNGIASLQRKNFELEALLEKQKSNVQCPKIDRVNSPKRQDSLNYIYLKNGILIHQNGFLLK